MSKGEAREGFDIDLEYGQSREDALETFLTDSNMKIEVKSDEKAKETGNIYVEYKQRKGSEWVDSGIAVTEADIWAVEVRSDNFVLLSTDKMKELAKRAYEQGKTVSGGDHNNTKGILVPIEWLVREPQEGE